MCYNCGCFIPHDNMGDSRNITESTLKKLAEKKNTSPLEIKKKLHQELASNNTLDQDFQMIFQEASEAWGQSVEDAKKETKRLLAHQLKA